MRIAYVGTLPPHPGGSAIHGVQLVAGLARRGHEISAISPMTAAACALGDPLAGAPYAVTRYRVPSFEVCVGRPSSEEFRALEIEQIVAHLTPMLEARWPDVVIAARETFAWRVPALARRHGVPSIVIAHGGATWGMLGGAYPREMTRALVAGMNEADRTIAVAHHFAERLRELGIERISTIQNAVDTRLFAPAPPDPALLRAIGIADDRIVVAHFSNLKDFKRPLDLVQSAALAVQRDPRLLYLIVGDGPLSESLEAECRRLAILDHFRFVGWVPFDEVPRRLHLAHVAAMPSETEALALAYLEAQACARVLIASDVPGAREVVENDVNGLLFPVGDVRALAEQTLRAAADPDLRASIGARARASALAHSIETELDGFEAVLASLVSASPVG